MPEGGGGGGGMNTKRSRAVSRGRGGSADESPRFQIKDGEIVAVGDTKAGSRENHEYYIRLDQKGVVPPPFDRSLIGKAEDGGQQGGEGRTTPRKKRNAHNKRQGVCRKRSLRYINIPSRIGIALDSVKAAHLKATFYDKLYQEKKAREEKLSTIQGTTDGSQSITLSTDTCERALAKVRKSRSGPFYLNHLSMYVKSVENGQNQPDNGAATNGCVCLKSRSPSHSKIKCSKEYPDCDDLFYLIQRSKNCKPRDLPITNAKSSSTGIFYKARSEKMRRQSRWSPAESFHSSPSSYSDSPKIVNAAHDWVDASCATVNDAQRSASGDQRAEAEEEAREKAIRKSTGLDFKSLKRKLDSLLRKQSELRGNKRDRSFCNHLSLITDNFVPVQVADAPCSKPIAVVKNPKSKRNKQDHNKSPQRKRVQDSQSSAKSAKKHVAFAVFDSPLECSNNRSDTGDNSMSEADAGPRISQTSEPDNRGLQSVSLTLNERHVVHELSMVCGISGASGNRSSTTKSSSLPSTRVQINPDERSKGKYLTVIEHKALKQTFNRYLRRKSPAGAVDGTGKTTTSNEKAVEPSSENKLQEKSTNINISPFLSPKKNSRRTSPERVGINTPSLEVKSHNGAERDNTPDDWSKTQLDRHCSFTGKERNRAASKLKAISGGAAAGEMDCQSSASFRKCHDAVRRRRFSSEARKEIEVRSLKLSKNTTGSNVSEVFVNTVPPEAGQDVLPIPPENCTTSKDLDVTVTEKQESSLGATNIALVESEMTPVCRMHRRTSDPNRLYSSKRLVRNKILDIVGQQTKSSVNIPVRCESREKKISFSPRAQFSPNPIIRRRTSDPSSLKVHTFKSFDRKSLSEISRTHKKYAVAENDSQKNHKGSLQSKQSNDQSLHNADAHKADMNTEEVKSAVHKRLYGSVSSQSIAGCVSSHVKGFQTFKALTRGSYSDKDVSKPLHDRKSNVGRSNDFYSLPRLESPVDVISENPRSPIRFTETLATVNEVSFEVAGEEYKEGPKQIFRTDKEMSQVSPESDKILSKPTGIYRHRRQGVDNSSKGDDTLQKNTYLDMLFSEVIPRVKTRKKKQSHNKPDLSSSVDPEWIPPNNPADSYFVQASVIKPEVYGVSEMLSDLRKVRTVSMHGDLQEARVSTGIKHKTHSIGDLLDKTKTAMPKSADIMPAKKKAAVDENKKTIRISFKNAKLKTSAIPIRSLTLQPHQAFSELPSTKSRSQNEPIVLKNSNRAVSLSGPVIAAKPTPTRRLNGATIKAPSHAVLRTNVRQAHLSKNSAAMRQADKQKGPASKAPPFKAKSDTRSDKTPQHARPQLIVLVNRSSKTNTSREPTHKHPPKEGTHPVDHEDVYAEPPSEAARRQKLAYMNYVKTGTRLVFPENTIQVIKYITQFGVEDADSSDESSPNQRPSKRPRNQKSPTNEDQVESASRDKKKAPGSDIGEAGLAPSRATDAKRYLLSKRKSSKVVANLYGSKSKRAKTSAAVEDNKIRHGGCMAPAVNLTSDSSPSGLLKSGASSARSMKSDRAAKPPKKVQAMKRSERASTHQAKPSPLTLSETAKKATPHSRKQAVKLYQSTKASAAKCRKKSSYKAKEGSAPVRNHQVDAGASSAGRHGHLPLARRKSLQKRLRKPRGENKLVENRIDSVKSVSLPHSTPGPDCNALAVGFEENIIKLADNLLRPGQKILTLAFDSIMNLVHFKRGSGKRNASPTASILDRRGLKKKRSTKKTKARTGKRSTGGSPTFSGARSRSDLSRALDKEVAPKQNTRSPEYLPSSSVDAPYQPDEAAPSYDNAGTNAENLRESSISNKTDKHEN